MERGARRRRISLWRNGGRVRVGVRVWRKRGGGTTDEHEWTRMEGAEFNDAVRVLVRSGLPSGNRARAESILGIRRRQDVNATDRHHHI